ncbi:MAG: MarR family winged helix-turn-helix transcriptional regulator [Pseudomonadota bacterium]
MPTKQADAASRRRAGGKPAAPRGRSMKHDERVLEVLRKFRVVIRASQQHSRRIEAQVGLAAPQLWALTEVVRHPSLRVADLAGIMSLHQSTASNLLDQLEGKGMISRARDPDDQRMVRLYPTREGEALLRSITGPSMGLLPDTLFRLPDSLLRKLDEAMSEVVAELRIKDAEDAFEPLNRLD